MKLKAESVSWYRGYCFRLWSGNSNVKDLKQFAARTANNLKNCSCSMCCNPRHNGWSNAITKQEYLFYIKYLEETSQDIRKRKWQ